MIHLIQLIAYMSKQGYTSIDIDDAFTKIDNGDYSLSELYKVIKLEPTMPQHERIRNNFRVWTVALDTFDCLGNNPFLNKEDKHVQTN